MPISVNALDCNGCHHNIAVHLDDGCHHTSLKEKDDGKGYPFSRYERDCTCARNPDDVRAAAANPA